MTTEKLKAIDALVAEKVFGYQYWEFTQDDGSIFIFLIHPDAQKQVARQNPNYRVVTSGDEADAPRYSTDITIAWRVVEKMVDLRMVFIVKGDGLREKGAAPQWTVLCDRIPRACAETAALAICLAALASIPHDETCASHFRNYLQPCNCWKAEIPHEKA